MIRRLELHRWRSFERVGLNLQKGTTFLVAPNGVGKTSLLLGLAWGLFGDHSGVDAKTCIRLGNDTAETIITIELSENRELTISRTISRLGRATVEYNDGNASISPPKAEAWLTDEFGAPLDIAARLAVIRGSGAEEGELQLNEHLYDAFGISGLRRAAAEAQRLHKQAEATRKKLRSASRSESANREQLGALAGELEVELTSLRERRQPLAFAFNEAQRARHAARDWDEHDSETARRDLDVHEFIALAPTHGLSATTLDDLDAQIAAAGARVRANLDRLRRTYAQAEAQALAARSAMALLDGHDPACPTCARPFDRDELAQAIAAQVASLAIAVASMNDAESAIQGEQRTARALEELRQTSVAMGRPIPAPQVPRPTHDVDEAVAAAQRALQDHDEESGAASQRLAGVSAALADDDAMHVAYKAERTAWEREALTRAAADALTTTAKRLALEQIEPISNQVRLRWKALFGEDGLQLRPDGTIVRVVGERELPWNQLSSGEQIWARLVASLLILRSSTTIPFAWLDEPLEHLDPRARRIVASDLAGAARSGRPAQMIVTTYEHVLVRQLSEDMPDTKVTYINHWQVPPGDALAQRYRQEISADRQLTLADEDAIHRLLHGD